MLLAKAYVFCHILKTQRLVCMSCACFLDKSTCRGMYCLVVSGRPWRPTRPATMRGQQQTRVQPGTAVKPIVDLVPDTVLASLMHHAARRALCQSRLGRRQQQPRTMGPGGESMPGATDCPTSHHNEALGLRLEHRADPTSMPAGANVTSDGAQHCFPHAPQHQTAKSNHVFFLNLPVRMVWASTRRNLATHKQLIHLPVGEKALPMDAPHAGAPTYTCLVAKRSHKRPAAGASDAGSAGQPLGTPMVVPAHTAVGSPKKKVHATVVPQTRP